MLRFVIKSEPEHGPATEEAEDKLVSLNSTFTTFDVESPELEAFLCAPGTNGHPRSILRHIIGVEVRKSEVKEKSTADKLAEFRKKAEEKAKEYKEKAEKEEKERKERKEKKAKEAAEAEARRSWWRPRANGIELK